VLCRVLYPLWKQDCYFSYYLKNIEGAEEARNVSMQAAAMSPIALDESELMLQLSKRN
jgi:translation elongation factor EF-Ts